MPKPPKSVAPAGFVLQALTRDPKALRVLSACVLAVVSTAIEPPYLSLSTPGPERRALPIVVMESFDVMIRVLPIALAGALSPFNVSVVILMLLSKDHPIARSVAFISGFTLSLVLIGSIALSLSSSFYAPPLRPRVYMLLLVLGVLMLVLGTRQVVAGDDPDQPPQAWMEKVSKFRAFTAFWVGFFLSMFGVKTLAVYIACLGIITSAQFLPGKMVLEIAVVVLVIISTMLIPVVIYIFEPVRGAEILGRMRDWMTNRQHVVAGAVLVVVGVLLTLVGLSGLF